ncbi:MAG: MerR family transcriptional regulator [Chloroflexota bacterium]|nr:MerR family transcriptional regulator [Chloroflexota bacterium]
MTRADRPVYAISIAASLAGCHPRTLRIYEEVGLVEPVRTHTNIRLYSEEDVQRVRCIRYLTQIRGVNLAGVKLLLQLRDISELLEEVASQLEEQESRRDPEEAGRYGGAAAHPGRARVTSRS